ncbi:histidine phosphatase family protein [Aliivibrio kagoshimensis]|uniref:histidine phosphatase family protein n=1 Tax=Aliivibrio kagoshimensis TaxID=2910230 RepID=UPI003D0D7561
MTRRVFVLRHGETQFNAEKKLQGHCNSPLTTKGTAQAHNVGASLTKYLGHQEYRVYSSPLGRAIQTAQIVCDEIGHPSSQIIEDSRLKEFMLGSWEQRTVPSLVAEMPNLLNDKDWYLKAPQAESYESVKTRLLSWLAERPESEDIVVISHALTGIVLRGILLNLSYNQVWEQDLPQDAFFKIEQGSVERINCVIETPVP